VDGRSRGIGRGLSPVERSGGALVAYAAHDGTIADNGVGEHISFTKARLANMQTPGLDIRIMFSNGARSGAGAHRPRQPFIYGSLPGEAFHFQEAVPLARVVAGSGCRYCARSRGRRGDGSHGGLNSGAGAARCPGSTAGDGDRDEAGTADSSPSAAPPKVE
jgi:hypothetical protein